MNIEPYDLGITDAMMTLLLMADPDQSEVKRYLNGASIIIAKDKDELIGIAVLCVLSYIGGRKGYEHK